MTRSVNNEILEEKSIRIPPKITTDKYSIVIEQILKNHDKRSTGNQTLNYTWGC